MAGLGDIVQKAFYLGIGLAATAGEKAGGTLGQLRVQAQKLADELVSKGEMTTEEARKFVDEMLKQAPETPAGEQVNESATPEPRLIEIVTEEEKPPGSETDVDNMRKQVQALQEELRRLKRD
jgi:polyhydroxyalkanoate synthesis regulator phasin